MGSTSEETKKDSETVVAKFPFVFDRVSKISMGRPKRAAESEKTYEEVESDADMSEAEKEIMNGKPLRRDGYGVAGEYLYSSGQCCGVARKSEGQGSGIEGVHS